VARIGSRGVGSPAVCVHAECGFNHLAGEANTAVPGRSMPSGSGIDAAAAISVGDNGPGLAG